MKRLLAWPYISIVGVGALLAVIIIIGNMAGNTTEAPAKPKFFEEAGLLMDRLYSDAEAMYTIYVEREANFWPPISEAETADVRRMIADFRKVGYLYRDARDYMGLVLTEQDVEKLDACFGLFESAGDHLETALRTGDRRYVGLMYVGSTLAEAGCTKVLNEVLRSLQE